ncbi:uncharacterized protein LOC135623178 [Musa acuminata AAA Group]|uniref:uncharacterized protein LOC135623178 n=1 Tax=Musa acuminata AAA Group TaxID=214697 RepID=UPI0031D11855
MSLNSEQNEQGDRSFMLDVARHQVRGGSEHSVFAPHPDPSDPTPTARIGSSIEAPEKKLTLFAFRLGILEKSASGLGTLAFVWATVVLLGGFSSALVRKDFVIVTVLLVTESTRIFGRSHELEWQHQAAWTTPEGAGRSSFRVVEDVDGRRTWRSRDVPLLPFAGWIFVSKNLSRGLSWLQLSSALACVVLSLMRLIQQDYGEVVGRDRRNLSPALNLFYGLALAEALIFLMEKAYWSWRISFCKLLEKVSRECDLGEVSIRRFFYDTYSKCIEGSVFDGLKMNLVTFAKELLVSELRDEQLIGVRVLHKLATIDRFSLDTLRKIGSSTRTIERLVEMLNWKNTGEEEEIRMRAAEIVSKLAEKRRNVLRVAAIPGAMEALSSLLVVDDSSDFNLLGLSILEKLASDHEDCWKIGNTRDLLPKIIDLTSARKTLLRNDHAADSQIRTVMSSLQVLKKLVSTTGYIGQILRQEVSEIVFTVSNIREILQHGESHMVLQKLGIEILKSLAMDESAREKIGSTGGVIKLLLSIFFEPGFTEAENSLRDEAGEALAMLTLESKKNCDRIVKETEVDRLMKALTDAVLQINASRILRNLCAYGGAECSHRLSGITAAMPTVLKVIMEAKARLLEASIGLSTEICKFLDPDEFAEFLKKAAIEETDLVVKLVQVLKEYRYPEIRVPGMRRFVIEQAIWMMRSNRNSIQLFEQLEMERFLEAVVETTSELECFHIFSGGVGLSRHSKTLSSLVETALHLMTAED